MPFQLRRSFSSPSLTQDLTPRSHLRRLISSARRFLLRQHHHQPHSSSLPSHSPLLTPVFSSSQNPTSFVSTFPQNPSMFFNTRRNITLKFLEILPDGKSRFRHLTRQQILAEVRLNASASEKTLHRSHRISRSNRIQLKISDTHVRVDGKRPRRGRPVRVKSRYSNVGALDHFSSADKRQGANRLTVRDMRQMDPQFTSNPAIWVREDAMVVTLESVRAIICHNKIFVFDPENQLTKRPIWYIKKRVTNREDLFLPFELRALEGILLHTCMVLEREFIAIEPELRQTLGTLPTRITNEGLEMLRLLEQRLNNYYSRARKVQQTLQAVLDEDEDMANMYLTEKNKNPGLVRNPLDHDEAEMLIETYMQNVDDVTIKAALLNRAIDDTENLIEIHLDTMQNRLLLVDLFITAITTTLSFGTLVASVFGMNMPLPDPISSLPSSQYYFYACVVGMALIMGIGLAFLMRWCQREGIYRGHAPRRRRLQMRQRKSVVVQASEAVQRQAEEVLEKTQHSKNASPQYSWEKDGDKLVLKNDQLVQQ